MSVGRYSREMSVAVARSAVTSRRVTRVAPLSSRRTELKLTLRIRRSQMRSVDLRMVRSTVGGASPSAMIPEGAWAGAVELARIALGRYQKPSRSTQGR